VDAAGAAAQLSDQGVPVEQIARLVGHTGGSKVTEAVYRKQLRPVIDEGARVFDRVFGARRVSHSNRSDTIKRPGPQLP
jgi:hypothetical protein